MDFQASSRTGPALPSSWLRRFKMDPMMKSAIFGPSVSLPIKCFLRGSFHLMDLATRKFSKRLSAANSIYLKKMAKWNNRENAPSSKHLTGIPWCLMRRRISSNIYSALILKRDHLLNRLSSIVGSTTRTYQEARQRAKINEF